MKYKLKDINFDKTEYKYSLNSNNGMGNTNCKLINFTYLSEDLEFQTPKVLIEKIVKENNKEYLILKIRNTEACKTFCTKILEMEEKHNKVLRCNNKWFNKKLPVYPIRSVFNKLPEVLEDICFTIKVPFKSSNPCIKIYDHDLNLFNYYHLQTGMEVICLISCNNLWINFDNLVTYNLILKEIRLTKLLNVA